MVNVFVQARMCEKSGLSSWGIMEQVVDAK